MGTDNVRVLLIDDDRTDCLLTGKLLSKAVGNRFELQSAHTYEDGAESLAGGNFDVCLVDYRLGEHTGLDLIQALSGNAGIPPIILLTGQGDHEIDVEAMRAGAADYLVKGQLSADMLERSIRYALERKRAQ